MRILALLLLVILWIAGSLAIGGLTDTLPISGTWRAVSAFALGLAFGYFILYPLLVNIITSK